jgi:hypothetical protein
LVVKIINIKILNNFCEKFDLQSFASQTRTLSQIVSAYYTRAATCAGLPGSNAGNRARAGVNIGSRAFASYIDKMNRNLVQHLSSVEMCTLRLQILGDLRKRIPIPHMEVSCGREEGSFIEGP